MIPTLLAGVERTECEKREEAMSFADDILTEDLEPLRQRLLFHPLWTGIEQGMLPREALRVFLDGMPRRALLGLPAAAFDTRYRMATWKSGSAARGIAGRLRRAGATLIMPPESFFVAGREGPLEQGELERAAQWAEQVRSAFEASEQARRGEVAAH